MKTVLTFGWEFPPNNIGGLGVACQGLVNGLLRNGMKVILVLPCKSEEKDTHPHKKIVSYDINLKIKRIQSSLLPYINVSLPQYSKSMYGHDIFYEIAQFAELARAIAQEEHFDFIHAHDWMTFPAAITLKKITQKQLFVHVHSTEFDRTGNLAPQERICAIEKEGMVHANKVIAVSNFTKRKIIDHYHINEDKIEVVHNGIEAHLYENIQCAKKIKNPVVLFLGRLTLQKGPDFFIAIAQKILSYNPHILFVMVGIGDMESYLMQHVASLGLADKIIFTGFLKGDELKKIYAMADVFIMPSVSEPFGLSALEAMASGVPIIISKQSGISEATAHCLKIDFWDIDKAASHVITLLGHQCLRSELSQNARIESKKFSWDTAAQKCMRLYNNQ